MKNHFSTPRTGAGWTRPNRLELALLLLILGAGAFFRLYRIEDYLSFRGDEGRDALAARRLLVNHELILTGPETSSGDLRLGPLYYYLTAPALWLANFSPVGPAVLVALFGVATIFLVWVAARDWFPNLREAGLPAAIHTWALIAALLYAASPLAIRFSHTSWNPNILPFWALLALYAAWRAWHRSGFRWLVVSASALACALQSHYLAFLVFPAAGLFWLLALARAWRAPNGEGQAPRPAFLLSSLAGGLAFLLLMSPLILYDARHRWSNLLAIPAQLSGTEGASAGFQIGTFLSRLGEAAGGLFGLVVTGTRPLPAPWGLTLLAITLAGTIFFIVHLPGWWRTGAAALGLLVAWLLAGLAGLAVYPGEIFAHYYTLLLPAPFLLLAGLARAAEVKAGTRKARIPTTLFSLAFAATIFLVELAYNPLKFPPERQLQRTEAAARKIAAEAGGQPLNLAVIADRNYEDGYQYFLEDWGVPVVDLDPERPRATRAGQLFIVCEQPRATCDPRHEPRAIVAKFGRARVSGEWALDGLTLYRLVPVE